MALLCTGRSGSGGTLVAVARGGILVVGEEHDIQQQKVDVVTVSSTDSAVSCLGLSSYGSLLAACCEDKSLRVWNTTDWQLKGSREVLKRATAVVFSRNEEVVLVADKTGEVWQYSVTQLTLPGTHLLGHFSMLLDMVMPSCASHVITCDRDEKIRVSKYPNSYNIESYCLGHKEFVSTLCLCDKYPDLLLSGSGDGSIRVWNWREGKLLHTEFCPCPGQEPLVVVQLVCSHGNTNTPLVAAIIESLPEVLLYNISSTGQLSPCSYGNLRLSTSSSDCNEPWSCAFDWSDNLWICWSHPSEPLLRYTLVNGELEQSLLEGAPLLSQLNKTECFKGATTEKRSFEDLKKHTFDNMSVYLARKEERIKEQKEKKVSQQATTVESSIKDTVYMIADEVAPEQAASDVSLQLNGGHTKTMESTQPPTKRIKTNDSANS